MAVALVQKTPAVSTSTPGGSATLTFPAPVTAANMVVLVVLTKDTGGDAVPPTSITDDGSNTYTQDVSRNDDLVSSKENCVAILHVTSSAGGMQHVTLSGVGVAGLITAVAYEYSGADASSIVTASGTGAGDGSTASPGAITISANGAGVAAFTETLGDNTITLTSAGTEDANQSTSTRCCGGAAHYGTAGAWTPEWSLVSDNPASVAIAFGPSVGGRDYLAIAGVT